MRISTLYQFDSSLSRIRNAQSEYFLAQKQISTGKRWELGSEDPISASLSLDSRRLQSRLQQYQDNLRSAKDYLGNTENIMSETSALVNSAYTTAVQAASGTNSTEQLNALANQVTEMQNRLITLANSQGSRGQYLFAGHKTDTKPFTQSGATLAFAGDNNQIRVETGQGEMMSVSLGSPEAFFTDIYNELETLKTNIQNGDLVQLSDQSIADMQNRIRVINQTRGDIGTKLQTVEKLEASNTRRLDDFTKEISDLEDVDLSEAFVRYQQSENTYMAALQVASKGMELSLMDFIR
ncbi:MAG: flagellar hook-associated protein FlgL [Armatimonadetes bacterium]|nr:flagellar hook-associated protein FlgL [Armatimonadota bacterium]